MRRCPCHQEGCYASEGPKDIVKVTNETDGNNPDKGNKAEYYNFKIRKDLFDEGLKNVGDASKLAPPLPFGRSPPSL
jgi:hypothetical protein